MLLHKKPEPADDKKPESSQSEKVGESPPRLGRPTSGTDRARSKDDKSAESKADPRKPSRPRRRRPFPMPPIELDEDRKPALHTGGDVLIKDATILTVTHGTIASGSILVKGGKIKAVGAGVTAPEGVKVINAAGMVAMPGIIDTHSHIAVQGGVNEGSLSIVPEVRVKDVVTGDDIAHLPGHRRRNDDRPAAARFGQYDRRPGRRHQAEVRQARPRPDHPRAARKA